MVLSQKQTNKQKFKNFFFLLCHQKITYFLFKVALLLEQKI